ncbi:MAG: CapA family protein, partial [Actinomycetota bacterium]
MNGSERGDRWRLGGALAAMLMVAGLSAATVTTPGDPPDRLALDRPERPQPLAAAATRATTATSATTPTSAPVDTADGTEARSTTSTVPASQPTSTTAPPRDRLVIHGVGDTNFDPGYIPNLATFGYGYAFEGLGGLFERDDLTVVNLECAPSERGQRVPKTFNFRCDPAALPVATANGVEVANLANNHVLDYGVEAMLDGKVNVEAAGMAAVGVGADVAEATTPAILDIGGWSVAVLGMGGVVPAGWWLATDDRPGMASGDDIDQMVAAVEAADAAADLVVVSIHWGAELVTEPDDGD